MASLKTWQVTRKCFVHLIWVISLQSLKMLSLVIANPMFLIVTQFSNIVNGSYSLLRKQTAMKSCY